MKGALFILVGALVGFLAMAVAVYVYGLLAVWSPFPRGLWATHGHLVAAASAALAFIPFVVGLSIVLFKLFRPHAAPKALVSMLLVTLLSDFGELRTPGAFFSTMLETWRLTASFLVGVPLLVLLIETTRSNQRLERP